MTTSYERLREECNKGLPERYADERVSITDVLRVLLTLEYIEYDGGGRSSTENLSITTGGVLMNENGMHIAAFTLSLPLSAPENEAACEAVLKLLDSEKDRVFVCREGDDYANCL